MSPQKEWELERRLEKLERLQESASGGCAFGCLSIFLFVLWPLVWTSGGTNLKPFWIPDRVPATEWREKVNPKPQPAKEVDP